MVDVAFVLAISGAFSLGFLFRTVWDKVKALEGQITTKIKAEQEAEQPQSTFIDAEDIVQRAKFEQDEIQRKLNPDES